MKRDLFTRFGIIACLLSAGSLTASAQTAQQSGSDQQMTKDRHKNHVSTGPHGGSLRQTSGVQLETVVSHGGIQLFVYDRAGEPLSVAKARGATGLRVEGNAKQYRYDLLPDGKGGLAAPVNLTAIAGRQIELAFRVVGLASVGSEGVTFREVAMVPATEQQMAAAAIARQKVCPVSGKPLGSMGDPVAVDVNGQSVFVCCAGCVDRVKAEPEKYLAMVYGEAGKTAAEAAAVSADGEQVRPGVFKVAAAEAPFVAAQKSCPVMDEPLDAMGGPYRVDAAGKAVYICCPGCAKKIAADPQKYLAILSQQGVDAPMLR